jgi:anion-transporting  ArsA/GET3 family ATPase
MHGNRTEVKMQETKLTIRLPRKLLENAKRYARQQNTTLTNLISEYLVQIPAPLTALENAPIVRRISGTLSQDVSVENYKQHLAEKYGVKN